MRTTDGANFRESHRRYRPKGRKKEKTMSTVTLKHVYKVYENAEKKKGATK